MLMPFSNTFSGVYPNVTSFSWSTGGEIFSVSGSLNVSVSSSSGGVSSGSFSRILILDCACAARFALYRQRSMKACRCFRYSIWVSYSFLRLRSRSDFVE